MNDNDRHNWLAVVVTLIIALIMASFAYTELRVSRIEQRLEQFSNWVYQTMYGPRR